MRVHHPEVVFTSTLVMVYIFYIFLSFCFCRSYHPYWEGKICVESLPVHNLSSVEITDSGTVKKITGWAFVGGAKPIRVCLCVNTS